MKTVNKLAAQGDVLFIKVKKLPKEAIETSQKEELVVAHSETGHNHVVENATAQLFEIPNDPFTAFIKVKSPSADVVHHRSWDTHETLRLLSDCEEGETIWEIRRQREFSPEGWRRVAD